MCLLLAVAMVFGIVGCNNNTETPDNTDGTTYIVTFDVQGHGTAPVMQTVDAGAHANEPSAPSESGWTFGGWFKEADCENEYNFASETVTKNITLYAKWTQDSVEMPNLPNDKRPTIYLAGDSTVQGYGGTQFIAGWGQYLNLFLDGEVSVVNCARGGRSSRSFINEGRLFTGSYYFSENGGKSIEESIKEGDYLFVQFGHNDDNSKTLISNLYDRMVPLGTPDSNGIYPVTAPGGKQPTTYLPKEYTDSVTDTTAALTEIAKYGSEYYAYDCGGTYKWYLKQYIDLAREKGAIPVLVTPVARVSFNSDGTLKSGPGLHGENFAYVKAVRQLAEEEDCLLIDLFADTKDIIETATVDYAKFLMAHVPNSLTGNWPTDYDNCYNNSKTGWTGMESTHYNKYGAFISAAMVAEHILGSYNSGETHKSESEYFNFSSHVKTTPTTYLDPSNLISKTKIGAIEKLFKTVSVTNPDRTYPDHAEVIAEITKVCTGEVTADNYLDYQEPCEAALALYYKLNIDDRDKVTNYATLARFVAAVNQQIEAHRDKPSRTVLFDPSGLAAESLTATKTVTVNEKYGEGAKDGTPGENTGNTVEFKIVGASGKAVDVKAGNGAFTYNGTAYSVTKYLSMGGSASFGSNRYIEFATTGACRIIVAAMSTGDTDRNLNLVNADNTKEVIKSYKAPKKADGVSVEYIDTASAGRYMLGSGGSGIYVYGIIIEVVEHTHSWEKGFHYNGSSHWHICATCGEASEQEAHDWENGACNICGLKDLTNTEIWATVESEFDYAAAVAQYGITDPLSADTTIGKFTIGAGAYMRADNINTQSRTITVTLSGATNSISFEGSGQSNSAVTQFTLWKGDVNVTPADWATDSKDRRVYSIDDLEAGTYTIRTNVSGAVFGLKVTEVVEKN